MWRKSPCLSNSAELDEAEEKPCKGVHPNKAVISQSTEPHETMRRAFIFKIPDGRLWFVLLVQSLRIKPGRWGVSRLRARPKGQPFGNPPLS